METNNNDTTKVVTKTYNQTDIDNSYNAGYAKAKRELTNTDDYKKFLEFQKGNAETLKINEDLQQKYNAVLKEKNDLINDKILSKSNVKSEFADFVLASIQKNVNDEKDFETALEEFKKEKPQYFGDVVIKKVQTAPPLAGSIPKPITTNDIMNNIIRGNV